MSTSSPLSDKTRTPAMFSSIAHRYDLLNHLLSLNIDRSWRRSLVRHVEACGARDVLDVATGTGDVALALAKHSGATRIIGIDPSEGMLQVGQAKVVRAGAESRIRLMKGDALELPFDTATFDAVTIAFGLRNLPHYARGVREMSRVLKPGGQIGILEFFPPRRGPFLAAYRFYLGRVLPLAGRFISGSPEAYRYLADSIKSFISHEQMLELLGESCDAVAAKRLTGGVAWIYTGTRRR